MITSAKVIGEDTIKLTFSETVHNGSDTNSLDNRIFSVKSQPLKLEKEYKLFNIDSSSDIQKTIAEAEAEAKSIPYFVQNAELSGNTITLTLTEKLVDGTISVTIDNKSTDDNITITDYSGNKQTTYTISFSYKKNSIQLYP